MNKILAVLVLVICLINNGVTQDKILKRVIICSRHNLRVPFTHNLRDISSKPWPKWIESSSYLTAKGVMLEGFMGEYFSSWLKREYLLPEGCPTENDFFAYANVKQRTILSAQSFIDTAFPNCNIKVFVTQNKSDDTFLPVVHNDTDEFVEEGKKYMNERLHELQLENSLSYLDEILDFRSSEICKVTQKCNLVNDTNNVYLSYRHEPDVFGPLKIGNRAVDTFVMEYYEGKEIAWGKLVNDEQWKQLLELLKAYHNVRFNTSHVANDIAYPIVKYMKNIWLSEDDSKSKVTLLVGHDANLLTILRSMKFKPYILPNQYELIPIGGKLVFQEWFDLAANESYLKIEYVYHTWNQLRYAQRLTLEDPPASHIMEIEDCKIDSEGYCRWNDFVKVLDRF